MTGHEHMQAAEQLLEQSEGVRRSGNFPAAQLYATQAAAHATLAHTAATVDLLAAQGVR